MTAFGYLLIAAGVLLAGVAVTHAGPFLGSLLGPLLIVAGGIIVDARRVQRARARDRRRRPGYVHPRI